MQSTEVRSQEGAGSQKLEVESQKSVVGGKEPVVMNQEQKTEDKKLGRLEDKNSQLHNLSTSKLLSRQPLNLSDSQSMNSQLQINKIAPSPASPTTVEEESQGIGIGQYIIVKFDVANIREMPSLDSKEVGWASKGSQFVVLQEHIDNKDNIIWYQVPYHGEKRWISANVVDIVEIEGN
ncbi:MAG: SH3 domain-containing protein [Nitrospirae bacterium]|nr:SH3 domain-containing protein [Nitrospirota bacterium]